MREEAQRRKAEAEMEELAISGPEISSDEGSNDGILDPDVNGNYVGNEDGNELAIPEDVFDFFDHRE